jgi:hypothetical protein
MRHFAFVDQVTIAQPTTSPPPVQQKVASLDIVTIEIDLSPIYDPSPQTSTLKEAPC